MTEVMVAYDRAGVFKEQISATAPAKEKFKRFLSGLFGRTTEVEPTPVLEGERLSRIIEGVGEVSLTLGTGAETSDVSEVLFRLNAARKDGARVIAMPNIRPTPEELEAEELARRAA